VLSFVLYNRKEYYVHKKHIVLNKKKHISFIWIIVYRRQLKRIFGQMFFTSSNIV